MSTKQLDQLVDSLLNEFQSTDSTDKAFAKKVDDALGFMMDNYDIKTTMAGLKKIIEAGIRIHVAGKNWSRFCVNYGTQIRKLENKEFVKKTKMENDMYKINMELNSKEIDVIYSALASYPGKDDEVDAVFRRFVEVVVERDRDQE